MFYWSRDGRVPHHEQRPTKTGSKTIHDTARSDVHGSETTVGLHQSYLNHCVISENIFGNSSFMLGLIPIHF